MNIRPSAKPQATSWGTGYEPRDISVGGLAAVLAFMAVAAFTIHFVLVGLVNTLNTKSGPHDQWSGSKPSREALVAPGPRLQVSPTTEMRDFRERETLEMTSYGWIDKSAGTVRLPIDRAIDVALAKGFPVREGTSNASGPGSLQLQQERAK